MSGNQFTLINGTPRSPSLTSTASLPSTFTLPIPPATDIYATPPPTTTHTYTAPILHRITSKRTFKSARVTISAAWTYIYDQGGLIFTIASSSNPAPDGENSRAQDAHPQWVKCGLEMNEGRPCVSAVGKQREGWADWSLWPINGELRPGWKAGDVVTVTLEIARHENALKVLRVLQSRKNGPGEEDEEDEEEKVLVREVPWVFLERDGEETAFVGVYGARPDPHKEAKGDLEVTFTDFQIVD